MTTLDLSLLPECFMVLLAGRGSIARATMKQERLNHLLLLHVHKDFKENLSCIEVVKSLAGDSEQRCKILSLGDFLPRVY